MVNFRCRKKSIFLKQVLNWNFGPSNFRERWCYNNVQKHWVENRSVEVFCGETNLCTNVMGKGTRKVNEHTAVGLVQNCLKTLCF